MRIYLVGGALRDRLLNLPVKDRDWLVVGATTEEMLKLGYRQADADFPVFLHPESGEEYALARSETKNGPGYKGFEVSSDPQVTLEQDLQRRDLTINAMVEDEQGTLIDPFNGKTDLDTGLLRHISPAFVEDPVRLLRIARFAAKLGGWGFRVAHTTHKLMKQMAASDDITALKSERVWQEMVRALGEVQPWRFFEVLHRCGALERILPELAQTMRALDGHAKEGGAAAISALKRAAEFGDSRICFAVIFYYPSVVEGAKQPLMQRLRAERDYSDLLELVLTLVPIYQKLSQADAAGFMQLQQRGRALQQPERFWRAINACEAIQPEQAEKKRQQIELALSAAATVTAAVLQAEGLQGAALGAALTQRRLQAIAAIIHNPD
ncbi:MAG: multifunctional CCA tRNA nucleotidyl transferase/2'3'-cyclic phosphodiesterase/2'nucleotidase/phosphatase [Sedimenticola sp.]